jgi:hypothetical protein
MATPTLVSGDDIVMSVQLYKDGATFNINAGATVEARLVSLEHDEYYTDPVVQSNSAPGAAWATSLVTVEFAEADTLNVTHQGAALLEIQVDDNGKSTWFEGVAIVTGTIP